MHKKIMIKKKKRKKKYQDKFLKEYKIMLKLWSNFKNQAHNIINEKVITIAIIRQKNSNIWLLNRHIYLVKTIK